MAITINGSGTISGISVGGLPDGTVDEGTLATDSVTTTKIPAALENTFVSGRKNMVINGAMKVAQRGTSSTGLGDGDEGYVTLDRMRHTTNSASAGRFTSAQTAITDLVGFANCLHFDCTTADTSIAAGELLVLEHRIEGQDLQQFKKGTASAEDITVSFYMKTNKAFTFTCVLNDFDNNRVNPQQFTTTTTWTRHSITFAGDTTGTLDDDANISLSVSIYLHAGSNYTGGSYSANTWQSRAASDNMVAVGIGSFYDSTSNDIKITGLQMELGSTATDFEHRSYGEELALCQRYYQTTGVLSYYAISRWESSSGNGLQWFEFHTPMRAAPSTSTSGTWLTGLSYTALNQFDAANEYGVQVEGNQTQGASKTYYAKGGSLNFDAEL